ncbi:MAG: aromatic-ring-hydroxylating dioxygenase subunit beta [Acidimicrobiales bacterium]|nr:aromatic-ring-hydroxylating dioxygenase subunit beta [Acidimicrobiales bacterium]
MDEVARHHEVAQWLYREARLLDERRYTEWLDLWTDHATYVVPTTRVNAQGGLRSAGDGELHLLRTGKDVLRLRIEKLRAGNAWAEEPPSQTVRTISNIEVSPELEGLLVRSNVVLHRVRYTDDTEVHAASRADRLVSVDGAWRLAERRVRLAHGALRAANFQLFL